jgi:signal transduction histidine kinase
VADDPGQVSGPGSPGPLAPTNDLRGPLAVASGRLQLARARLRRGDADPEAIDAELAAAESALARVLAAIEQVEEAERILDRVSGGGGGDVATIVSRLGPNPLDGQGAVARAAAVARTVAALRLTEAAAVAARAAAEDAHRVKSALLTTTTHELRTPLTAIIGYASLLEGSLGAVGRDSDARDAAQITRSAEHLNALVNDLLDAAKIQAGKLTLHVEGVDLGTLVAEVVAQMSPVGDAKGISLKTDVPAALQVAADALRLRQVLFNLVGNAVKFTDRGTVTVTARPIVGGVEVTVADTGIGISPEALPHVFDEFRQADAATTRRFGGTGLGLSIARRLVELHGGTIRANSTPGAGSTFTVMLPVSVAPAGALAAATRAKRPVGAMSSRPNPKPP